MSKLSKEKKEKLILTVIGVLGALGLLYTFGVGAQNDQIKTLNSRLTAVEGELFKAERLVKNAGGLEEELKAVRAELAARQVDMAPQGNYYAWVLKLLDGFRQEQRLSPNFIMDVTQPEVTTVGLLPKFPYNAGYFGVRVSGEFHEIGRFFAEFENRFPYMRIQSVKLTPFVQIESTGTATTPAPPAASPLPSGGAGGRKILAEFKIVTLFNPGTT